MCAPVSRLRCLHCIIAVSHISAAEINSLPIYSCLRVGVDLARNEGRAMLPSYHDGSAASLPAPVESNEVIAARI